MEVLLQWYPVQESTPPAQTPPTSLPSPPAQQPLKGWCPIHEVQMKLQTNERGSWYSHQTVEGWCRGKKRKSA